MRGLGLARLHRLASDLPRKIFCRHLAVAVHQYDQRFGRIILHDERFDNSMLIDAQFARRYGCAAVFFILVRML